MRPSRRVESPDETSGPIPGPVHGPPEARPRQPESPEPESGFRALWLRVRSGGRGSGQPRTPGRPGHAESVAQPSRPPRNHPHWYATPESAVAANLAEFVRWAGDFAGRRHVE